MGLAQIAWHRSKDVERLDCPPTMGPPDETILLLARALNYALARPSEASALFADHIFIAMTVHLAVSYGGIDRGDAESLGAVRPPPRRSPVGSTPFSALRAAEW